MPSTDVLAFVRFPAQTASAGGISPIESWVRRAGRLGGFRRLVLVAAPDLAPAARAAAAALGPAAEVVASCEGTHAPRTGTSHEDARAIRRVLDALPDGDVLAFLLPETTLFDEEMAAEAVAPVRSGTADLTVARAFAGTNVGAAGRGAGPAIDEALRGPDDGLGLSRAARRLGARFRVIGKAEGVSAFGPLPDAEARPFRISIAAHLPVAPRLLGRLVGATGLGLDRIRVRDVREAAGRDPEILCIHPWFLVAEISTERALVPVYHPLAHLPGAARGRPARMDPSLFHTLGAAAVRDLPGVLSLEFAGWGDALEHPAFPEMLRSTADGYYERTLHTDGLRLDAATADLIVESGLENLLVSLDAATPETYRRVRGADRFAEVEGHVRALMERRRARIASPAPTTEAAPPPVTAVTMTCIEETAGEIDAFLDRYGEAGRRLEEILRKDPAIATDPSRHMGEILRVWDSCACPVDHAVLLGYSDHAGRLPSRDVPTHAPLRRTPCRRLLLGLFVRTDGSVVLCDRVVQTDGAPLRADEFASILDLWESEPLRRERARHAAGAWGEHPSCGACRDWHRPIG